MNQLRTDDSRGRTTAWRKVAPIRAGALAVALGALPGCLANQLPFGGDSGGSGGAAAAAATSTPAANLTGIDCALDSTADVTLCLGTSECPDTLVDNNVLPGCGFRTISGAFDLECVCNGTELCPIGVASTCAALPALLAHRTVADVCAQVGSGSCAELAVAPAPATTAGTGAAGATSSSTCDQSCAADCANSPTCLEACGC